tara:strand:+ start:2869 stop:3096 length:228 start_codon:yes stop_codon:yes gene_type:complete
MMKYNIPPINTDELAPKMKNKIIKRDKKRKKKKKLSYKQMMANITKATKTEEEKKQEKIELLKTPAIQPAKLLQI